MNARTVCLGLGLILAVGVAWGQPEVEWEIQIDGSQSPFRDEWCKAVLQSSDSTYVFACFKGCEERLEGDFWLIQANQSGDTILSRSYGQEDRWEMCNSAIMTRDGGYALAGNSASGGAGTNDFCLAKIDSAFDMIWMRSYGGGRDDLCGSVVETLDGGFILGGATMSYGEGRWDIWLIRIDGQGEEIWRRSYGSDADDECGEIIATADSAFVLVGNTGQAIWIMKLNDEGDALWSKEYINGDAFCFDSDIIETSDHGFAIAGQSSDYGSYVFNGFLLRVDEDGDSLWFREFAASLLNDLNAVIELDDGGFALGGSTGMPIPDSESIWLIRTDDSGAVEWEGHFSSGMTSGCSSIIQAEDNGFVLAGDAWHRIGEEGTICDIYLVKTTPDPASVRDPRSSLTPYACNLFPAYPNPFNATVTIPFEISPINRGATGMVRMAIFDPLGRRVAELIPNIHPPFNSPPVSMGGKYSFVWDANGMPAGQYIVRLEAGNEQLTQRLALVK